MSLPSVGGQVRGRRPLARLAAVLTLAVWAWLVPRAHPDDPRTFIARADLVFVGVDVLTMEGREPLRDQTLAVERTRISALGPRTRFAVPPEARIVEGRGRVLMPGLVDAHIHLRQAEAATLKEYLQVGITTAREMNGRSFILDWRDWIEAGELVGPRLRVAGPTLGNRSSPREGYPTPRDRAEARETVRRYHATGYDWVKVYSFLPARAFRGVMSVAGGYGLPVGGHVPVETGLAETISLRPRSIEHLTEYVGSALTPESRALDEADYRSLFGAGDVDWSIMDSLVADTAAARIWNVPTLVWFDRFLPAPLAEEAWLDPELRAQGERNRREVVRRLYDAGARLAVGTDSDAGARLPPSAIHDEIAAMVDAGIPGAEVLRLVTAGGAHLLGLLGEQGTVTVGKRADLLLLPCDPREDLECLRRPEMVVAAGRVVSEAGSE